MTRSIPTIDPQAAGPTAGKQGRVDLMDLYRDLWPGYHLAELGEGPFSEAGALIDLIKMCTHQTYKSLQTGPATYVDVEGVVISYRELAETLRWSVKRTHAFIQNLKRKGCIHVESTADKTRISLVPTAGIPGFQVYLLYSPTGYTGQTASA